MSLLSVGLKRWLSVYHQRRPTSILYRTTPDLSLNIVHSLRRLLYVMVEVRVPICMNCSHSRNSTWESTEQVRTHVCVWHCGIRFEPDASWNATRKNRFEISDCANFRSVPTAAVECVLPVIDAKQDGRQPIHRPAFQTFRWMQVEPENAREETKTRQHK